VAEYLQIHKNGQITLPASILQKAKLKEGDWLEVVIGTDGTIQLVPKSFRNRALAEKYQSADIDWMVKQKGRTE
jgi:AbrB family looped-hinge helix DNA binding protein